MSNMLRAFRELFGQLVTETPSMPRHNSKRKPHRTLLRLEELERRLVPAPNLTTWTDADSTHLASHPGNWTNGVPNSTTQAILDGNVTKDGITFDQQVTCDGILVRNAYIGAITILAATSSNATVEIQSNSTPSLITRTGSGNTPLNLTNGAALQVDSGAGLYLDDNNINNASTFVTGDGMAGEILNNSGSVVYKGYTTNHDYLKIPVLNNGSFTLLGSAYGDGTDSVGSTLEVTGSDALTGNVSWYQNATGTSTSLQGNVRLQADAGYTQNAGTLVTVAGTGNSLPYSYLSSGTGVGGIYLDLNINGGTVQFTSQGKQTLYSTLYIYAENVNVAGEIDVRIDGQNPPTADRLILSHMGSTMTFKPGAKFVVNPVGQVLANKTWGNVLTAPGGLKDTNNLTTVGNGTTVNVNSPNISVTS